MSFNILLSMESLNLYNIPLNPNQLSTENGGNLSAIDAYSDGIGIYANGLGEKTVNNNALNELVYKYGIQAKTAGVDLKSFVLSDTNNSADQILANDLGSLLNKTGSNVPLNGTPCNDGNYITINDIYVNGACLGESIIGTSCNDGSNLTINDIYNNSGVCIGTSIIGMNCNDGTEQTINDKYVSGICVGTNVEGQVCDDNNINTISDKYSNGICIGTLANSCKTLKENNITLSTGIYDLSFGKAYCFMTPGGGWTLVALISSTETGTNAIAGINEIELSKLNNEKNQNNVSAYMDATKMNLLQSSSIYIVKSSGYENLATSKTNAVIPNLWTYYFKANNLVSNKATINSWLAQNINGGFSIWEGNPHYGWSVQSTNYHMLYGIQNNTTYKGICVATQCWSNQGGAVYVK